jgi:hypothetical protein
MSQSRENLMVDKNNPYSEPHSAISSNNLDSSNTYDQKLKMRGSYSYKKENNNSFKPTKQGMREYDYTESSDGGRVASKLQIRNDPAFQSEYNYKADNKIMIPKPRMINNNDLSGEDEFKNLIESSHYSLRSGSSISPDRAAITDNSMALHVRESKYANFPRTIEKPKSNVRVSSNLFNAGESVMSNSINTSQIRNIRHSLMNRISTHKSSEKDQHSSFINLGITKSDIFPSTSTAQATNSTMVRIRGKNNRIMSKRGVLDLTTEEEYAKNAKRKEVAQAAERLRKIEIMEKKRVGKVKDQIIRLEDERKQDDIDRRARKKELIERKRKLLNDRKMLEIQKQLRLDKVNDASAVKKSVIVYQPTYDTPF